MSLINKGVSYEPGKWIGFIQDGEEGRIIGLLKDVRDSAASLNPALKNQRLDIVLKVIEEGEWLIHNKSDSEFPQVESNYLLDLSKAKNKIANYRQNSEGGCISCISLRSHSPFPGDYIKYCGKYEDEKLANEEWNNNTSQSTRIKKFYEIGCDDKEPIIKRKLEEVLKEHKNE